MIPIVLSAGRGSRLGEETQDCPKWFLELGNKNLYDYQLDALSVKFDTVYVVLGHGFVDRNDPDDVLPHRTDIDVIPVIYDGWEEVENAGSALFGLKNLSSTEDLLLLCGDIVMRKEVLSKFITKYEELSDDDCSAVAAFEGIQDEKTAVLWDEERHITDYGAIEGHEEAGMFILNENHIDSAKEVWSNNLDDWFPIIFPEVKSKAIPIDRRGHHEINTMPDLHAVREALAGNRSGQLEE